MSAAPGTGRAAGAGRVRTFLAGDLFCGAGGSSSGAYRAVRAMGFEDYHFTGNVGEMTRQIGNAVAVNTAAALVTAILGERTVALVGAESV